ncbi:hypothetical protein Kisp01_28290 [Kineosporia sp. NBRC 101677]|uniref:CGNR zinc finger domain-containing protein n=1 Tax=Kineosporia sp. NBRC 101677 TaxID=3032197 RepID=UPI0024A18020|nr:ABATE domain-containing protein [Kineosporia sp. NBRC 101677]GLY15814.1 hypothetical protein Kisp01_28290 [Kineosporia sp. NBRC 101677]
MFVYVSNRLSLDLLGTLKWRRDVPEEHLRTPADLALWSAGASLGIAVETDLAGLERVRVVREMLYRAITATRRGHELNAAEVAELNEVAAGPGLQMTLDRQGNVARGGTVDQLLTAVVRDAFELISEPALAKVKDCANDRCTRLYVDVSRAGNRRWCGMAECGNVAKVAAFRSRQKV